MQDFRKIKAWEKGHQVVLAVYRVTANYPNAEMYGLTSQTRRAIVSVTANIAEGCGRGSDADFARHLQIAVGSAFEVDSLLLTARDLGFLAPAQYEPLNEKVQELKRILNAFLQSVRRTQ
jgi:four helix bundle protein